MRLLRDVSTVVGESVEHFTAGRFEKARGFKSETPTFD